MMSAVFNLYEINSRDHARGRRERRNRFRPADLAFSPRKATKMSP